LLHHPLRRPPQINNPLPLLPYLRSQKTKGSAKRTRVSRLRRNALGRKKQRRVEEARKAAEETEEATGGGGGPEEEGG